MHDSGAARRGIADVYLNLVVAVLNRNCVGWVERSETHHLAERIDGFRGACHRARVRATRWLNPSYNRMKREKMR